MLGYHSGQNSGFSFLLWARSFLDKHFCTQVFACGTSQWGQDLYGKCVIQLLYWTVPIGSQYIYIYIYSRNVYFHLSIFKGLMLGLMYWGLMLGPCSLCMHRPVASPIPWTNWTLSSSSTWMKSWPVSMLFLFRVKGGCASKGFGLIWLQQKKTVAHTSFNMCLVVLVLFLHVSCICMCFTPIRMCLVFTLSLEGLGFHIF